LIAAIGLRVRYACSQKRCPEYVISDEPTTSSASASPSASFVASTRPFSTASPKKTTASRETYGAPRVHAELRAQNVSCCRNTVAKLLRQALLMPKCIRRFRVTTDSRRIKALPNLIGRVFTTDKPNACWLSDITYIPTREGWLYLAAVLEVYSRAVVGWAMSRTLDCKLAKDALSMAIGRRGPPAILHSDQGTTYAAAEYRDLVGRYPIRQSMSRKSDCWDTQSMMVVNTQSMMVVNDRPSLTRAGIGSLPLR